MSINDLTATLTYQTVPANIKAFLSTGCKDVGEANHRARRPGINHSTHRNPNDSGPLAGQLRRTHPHEAEQLHLVYFKLQKLIQALSPTSYLSFAYRRFLKEIEITSLSPSFMTLHNLKF